MLNEIERVLFQCWPVDKVSAENDNGGGCVAELWNYFQASVRELI